MNKLIVYVAENFTAIKISFSSVIAAVGGFIAGFLGGIDSLLITLVTLIVIDYITGVARAIYKKELSSSTGFKGIIRKVLMLLMVGLSVALQNVMPHGVPLREVTVFFFIANEGFSILENTAGLIPLPEKLRSVLSQIQEKTDTDVKADASEKNE